MTLPSTTTRPGRYGHFGGQYVPESLMAAIDQVDRAYTKARVDQSFVRELEACYREYAGRPSLLYRADRLSEEVGCRVYLKREDLNHTGSHKINNTLGQALLARRMGKPKLIAETGAGQHGVATATVAALFGMECAVFMGEEDMRRQALNVFRMRLLGSDVVPVASGRGTLKDAMTEAMRYWMAHCDDTHYVIGSVGGPHPYPAMVRDFQAVIGREARQQCLDAEGRLPTHAVACVGGGSNAMGLFHAFVPDPQVQLIGVEAGGLGMGEGENCASISLGSYGVLHGAATMLLQTEDGQVVPSYSVSAGLDYPAVGPEHAYLAETGRAQYVIATDRDALGAFVALSRLEGIIPALESAHAVAHVLSMRGRLATDDIVIINLSGRGDKDCEEVRRLLAIEGNE